MMNARDAGGRTWLGQFTPDDLEPLIAFWNRAFAEQRNFHPLSADEFRRRVLDCPAFDPAGLILAWHTEGAATTLVGLAHAFRPLPDSAIYARLGSGYRQHSLALLYVEPEMRQQGIGSRLLRAAENWLYYCPVYVAGHEQPCYGELEGPLVPFFGSTQHMGLSARTTTLLHFLRRRGYRPTEPGDISMRLEPLGHRPRPIAPDSACKGPALQPFDNQTPFVGHEQPHRREYEHWQAHPDQPFAGFALTDGSGLLIGHIAWLPMRRAGWAALVKYWVTPARRRRGLGRYLLDVALHDMAHAPAPRGGYQAVEVQTNYFNHPIALALYERTGFVVDEAWVNLVKT